MPNFFLFLLLLIVDLRLVTVGVRLLVVNVADHVVVVSVVNLQIIGNSYF